MIAAVHGLVHVLASSAVNVYSIVSSAVREDNPEVVEARRRGFALFRHDTAVFVRRPVGRRVRQGLPRNDDGVRRRRGGQCV